MTQTIKVLLVDDHQMVRLGLTSFLNSQEDIEVVGEATNGHSGYLKALKTDADVILMDLVMEDMDGIAASQAILKERPESKILILTSFLDDEKIFPALEIGVKGYLLKTSQAAEIAASIRKVAQGEDVISQEVKERLAQKQTEKRELHERLTAREFEVLTCIAKGDSNQQIADELFISLKTVKTHVSNLLTKLKVEDRTQAAIYALKHDLTETK